MQSAQLPGTSRAKVITAGICAVILTVGIGRFAYTPLLPIMREQAGLGSPASGWLAAINYIGYLGGALIASSIHTLQRKWFLYRLGLVLAVLTTLAMGMTTNVWLWLVLRLIAGWASTAGMLLGTGLVLNWLLRHRHKAELGIHFAGFGLGMVLSGLSSIVMDEWVSWSGQWFALGVIGALFMIPAWRWLPKPPEEHRMTLAADDARPSGNWLVIFGVAYFCGGFGYVITATFIVDIIHHMNAVTIPGNWVWIVMGVVAIPSCFLWDAVSNRVGQLRALTLAYALQTTSFALTAAAAGAVAILIGAVLFGATVIGTVSLTLSIIGKMFPRNPAKAMARLTISYGVAQILGPIVASYMAGTGNDYEIPLAVATAIGAAGTMMSVFCWKMR